MPPLGEDMVYVDLADADLRRKLATLRPVSGYCVCDRRFFAAARGACRTEPGSRAENLLAVFLGPWPVTIRGLTGYREIYRYAAGLEGAGVVA